MAHIARHGVKPGEVESVFENDPVDLDYDVMDGEERWASIGHTRGFRVLLVIWTMRGQAVRPITARPVSRARATEYLKRKGLTR